MISLKRLTLSGILPFSTNSFWLASLLALLVELHLSFLIGALTWFNKITKVVPFESVEVFRKDPFLALYFSLFSSMIFQFLCLLPSAALCADDLAIWSSFPSVPTAVEATQGALFRLEHWSEYWCLSLNPNKCEASFISVDPHQANLQPILLLLNSRFRFNPSPTFLGVTFDRTLSFSKHVSSLKAKFFTRLKVLRCISASFWGPSKDSLSVRYKSFLRSLLTYASPGWFPFLSVTNITKVERLHRAASHAITGCFSSSPIPLLSEASLPPLQVTLTHFNLSSYKQALRLPTSLSYFRFGQTWSETKGGRPSADLPGELLRPLTHSCFLLLLLGKLFLLALPLLLEICLPSLWSPPFPFHALALISLSRQGAALAHLDSLSPHDLVLRTDGSVPFPFGKGESGVFPFGKVGSGVLANCSLCGIEATLSFSAGPVCSSFFAEACAIVHALCWSRQHQQICHFSSLLLLSDSRSVLATLSSPPSFLLPQNLWQIW